MKALIFGGSGALGRAMVKKFSNTWKVTSIDFKENSDSNHNILLDPNLSPNEQLKNIKQKYIKKKNFIILVFFS